MSIKLSYPYISIVDLCDFLEFIYNKKLEKDEGADDDVYTLHDKRIIIKNL
jgi:hypothetical protein